MPQSMEGLHLTDSQACLKCPCLCLLLPMISGYRTRHSAQPPLARIFGCVKEVRFMVHALAPGRKEPFVPRQ